MNNRLSRRTLLQAGAASGVLLSLPSLVRSSDADTVKEVRLLMQSGAAYFLRGPYPATPVWCFNGQVPGPEIRVQQGQRLRVVAENRLEHDTSVHWHGIRLPNNMDGVPGLTQEPIKPGESFIYDFTVPDAGTYWYHPHQSSFEQIGRGLYGALIVEEQQSIQVDRELTWILDDWRLNEDAHISDDFGQMHDMSHGGRLGNVVTVNGLIQPKVPVRAGERLRLRLISTSNARNFLLDLHEHNPRIIAIDGQPVQPHEPRGGKILLGSAMRMDVVVDMLARPGTKFTVQDNFYRQQDIAMLDLLYSEEPPLRQQSLSTPIQLAANPLPEPDLNNAEQHELMFAGGAMGGMRGAMMNGQWTDINTMVQQHGLVWAMNGIAVTESHQQPLLTLGQNKTCILSMRNDTAFPHPIHLHGHSFRVISRNGKKTPYQEWQDTVLVMRGEQVDIAFVADNPGDWMLHCHILEHQASGMTGFVRVV